MAKTKHKLTAQSVKGLKAPGRHSDGQNLYLSISPGGSRRWVLLYRLRGKQFEMGLGGYPDVSLKEARQKAEFANSLLRDKLDPLTHKREAEVEGLTFADCAEKYIAVFRSEWKNPKHIQQWENTLRDYVNPVIGNIAVANLTSDDVMRVIDPIWRNKNETASRIRGRIEKIVGWAITNRYRKDRMNPAIWRGHMEYMLPNMRKRRKRKHHAALPYKDAPAFMAKLAEQEGIAAKALAFTILTAVRTVETTGARLDEINEAEAVWIIPAERMKAGREHRVPLTPRALEIVRQMKPAAEISGGLLFPGGRPGKPLSENAMLALLKRMGRDDITVHGFRSTFRDWVADETMHQREVAEMALAHTIESATEEAYWRSKMFKKHRALMEDWAEYLSKPTTN